jgi:molybdopterin-guanine dinucleotide biosynthesis protein A
MSAETRPLGLILAGGRARRMGGADKTRLAIGGVPIRDRIIARLKPQCRQLLVSARGRRGAPRGVTVVIDDVLDAGPLAGILAALDWAAENTPDVATVVTVPGDCPFIPLDLVERLEDARRTQRMPLACACSGDWTHPVVGLWPVDLRHELRHALTVEGIRKVDLWTQRRGVAIAEWPIEPIDPFFNVNAPDDVETANRLAGLLQDA